MQLSAEVSIIEKGFARIEKGYLRDSRIELEDLLKYTKTQLLVISDSVLTEEQSKGFDPHPLTLVDGRTDKNASDVNPLGQIEFISRQDIGEILLFAFRAVADLSKVLTGRYKSSHYVFLNGVQVATDLGYLKEWLNTNPTISENDVIRIVNIQPYARRLELLGVTAQRTKQNRFDKGRRKKIKTGILVTRPNGAYQLAYRKVSAKFGQNVKVSFQFLAGAQLGLSDYFKKKRKLSDANRTYLYPSLAFRIVKKGGLF